MKKLIILLLAAISFIGIKAQSVGIDTSTPNAKAALDISSTSKGLLKNYAKTIGKNKN